MDANGTMLLNATCFATHRQLRTGVSSRGNLSIFGTHLIQGSQQMKQGYLSQYFKGIAAKTLRAEETDPKTSHQQF
jgi:hypothetical protein